MSTDTLPPIEDFSAEDFSAVVRETRAKELADMRQQLWPQIVELIAEMVAPQNTPGLAPLYKALSAAQAEIKAAELTRENPHLKNRYATLAAVWDACREPLAKNGLAVVQLPFWDGQRVAVRTILAHESGAEIENTLSFVPAQATIQGAGSAITYARRYALSAMVGVCPDDDDDGHQAERIPGKYPPAQSPAPPPSPQQSEKRPGRKRSESAAGPATAKPASTTAAPPKPEGAAERQAFWSCVLAADGVLDGAGEMDRDATRAAVVRRLQAMESAAQIPPAPIPLADTSEGLAAWLASYQPAEVMQITEAYRQHAAAERAAEDESPSPAEEVVEGLFEGVPGGEA